MSMLRSFPNDVTINEMMAKQYLALRVLQQQKIIQALSIALSINFSDYQASLSRPKYAAISAISKKQQKNKTSIDNMATTIEILSDGEQQIVRKQQILIQQKQKNIKVELLAQKGKVILTGQKNIQHHPTSDQNHVEEVKVKDKTKQIKKKKKEIKQVTYSAPIPKVDQIQTCYLPKFGINTKDKEQKKMNLLKRLVDVWQVSHPKNQKREIRMLNS